MKRQTQTGGRPVSSIDIRFLALSMMPSIRSGPYTQNQQKLTILLAEPIETRNTFGRTNRNQLCGSGSGRIRIILASRIRIRVAKNQLKTWETRIRIDRNHHNIIFLNMKLHFCFTHINNLLIQSIISHSYGVLQFLWGKKSLNKFGIFSILGRIRIRITSHHITSNNLEAFS